MHDAAAQQQQLLTEIRETLGRGGATEANLRSVLDKVLARFDCTTGTVHALDPASGLLVLRAQRGIPEHLMDRVQRFPIGKGMGGIAAERRAPVQVCNLQTDTSGVARPAAKETRMEGSIAVPMLVGDSLRGVLGVAKPVPYEFTEAESGALMAVAAAIGDCLGRDAGSAAAPQP
jgi:signal transduction protein with GAF and PtsI domain